MTTQDQHVRAMEQHVAEIDRLMEKSVLLRPDNLVAVDNRSKITGLDREAIVNAILTAAFSFEEDDMDRIMQRGQRLSTK